MSELLSVGEASQFLGLHKNTIKRWEKEGILEAIRFGNRRDRRFKKEDLVKFLEQGQATGIQKPQHHSPSQIRIVLLIQFKQKILLGRKLYKPGKGEFTLPSGSLQFGETFEEAAQRLIFQQTNIHSEKSKLLCVANTILQYNTEKSQDVAVGLSIEITNLSEELKETKAIEKWEWFSLDRLPFPLYMPDQQVLRCYLEKRFY